MSDFWILRPMGPLLWAMIGASLLILAIVSILLRNTSQRTKAWVISIVCWITLIGFFVYKYYLSIDPEYNVLRADMGGFNWWGEFPLHLCNINLLLMPIAVLTKKRPLMSFCFFLGPLGALMALLMPGTGFSDCSIFLPRMLGYFGTHLIVFVAALAIGTFGLYRPRMKDLLPLIGTIFIVSLVIFGFNMLLRTTGLYPNSNYFYNVETEGNAILEIFYRWIPIPFLYELPSVLILVPYAALITLLFRLFGKEKDSQEA